MHYVHIFMHLPKYKLHGEFVADVICTVWSIDIYFNEGQNSDSSSGMHKCMYRFFKISNYIQVCTINCNEALYFYF
jgi:hypothetical protein